jgi:hypothetical protein
MSDNYTGRPVTTVRNQWQRNHGKNVAQPCNKHSQGTAAPGHECGKHRFMVSGRLEKNFVALHCCHPAVQQQA